MRFLRLAPFAALAAAACSSFAYDLRGVPFPVSAQPIGPGSEPFEADAKSVMWLHGLFGESSPDVAAMLQDAAGPCTGVGQFRVVVAATFHDWLVTHVTLGLVRMKTVTVRGERIAKT